MRSNLSLLFPEIATAVALYRWTPLMASTDPSKLAAVFDRQAAAMTLYARQWLDRSQAQDVVQEVFVRLLSQGRPPANVKAWLYRCVRNAAISAARSAARRRRRERCAAQDEHQWFEPGADDRIDAAAAQAALSALPAQQREVILLRIWSGMTLAEIAQVTGAPVSTVFDQYRAGLGAVRRLMEPSCRTETT